MPGRVRPESTAIGRSAARSPCKSASERLADGPPGPSRYPKGSPAIPVNASSRASGSALAATPTPFRGCSLLGQQRPCSPSTAPIPGAWRPPESSFGRLLAIGRLQAGPRPGQTHSGPVKALQAHGGTPGYPLQHPSTSIPSVASGSRPPRPPPPSLQHPSTSIPGAAGSALARWPVGPRRHPGLLRLSTLDQAAPDRAARSCGSY